MATPFFQPSHIVGNLIYLLFFFFKERKKKKLTKLKTFLLLFLWWGFRIGWDRGGVCFIFFLFSTTFGFYMEGPRESLAELMSVPALHNPL